MSLAWMNSVGPADYEPDYDAYIAECESVDDLIADVGSYDDWFPDLAAPVRMVSAVDYDELWAMYQSVADICFKRGALLDEIGVAIWEPAARRLAANDNMPKKDAA